ncbi:MAG TPA: esterase, partial [Blastocatellia bacterium]
MIKFKTSRIAGIVLLASIVLTTAFAQQPPRQPTPNDTLKSPEVLADGRVVFRLYAPKASEVMVGGDWISQGLGAGGKLTKDDQGVWSITV